MRRSKTGKQTEAQFLKAVIEYAQLHKWRVFHARPARTAKGWRTATQGDNGFPDCVFCREGVAIFAELKTEAGRLTAMQGAWLYNLPNAYLWRPKDWPEIEKVLK